MKSLGFAYRPPGQRESAAKLDFRQTIDPRSIWGKPEALVADGMGRTSIVVANWRNLASLGPKGKSLSAEEFDFHEALEGTVEKPGCEPKARQQLGGFSLEDAAIDFYENNRSKLDQLRTSADFQSIDRQFVRCSKEEGHQFDSSLAYFPARKKALEDFTRTRFESEPDDNKVLESALDLDAKMVATYKKCIEPHARTLSELAAETLGESSP